MKMSNRIIVFIIIAGIVGWSYYTLKSNKEEVDKKVYIPDANHKVFVSTQKVISKQMSIKFNYLGTLHATKETMLNSTLSGIIQKVYFNNGDYVAKGKQLAQLDDATIQSDFKATQIQVAKDSSEYARFLQASKIALGSVSNNQLDQLYTKWQGSKAMLNKLQKQLEYAKLKAPFSGYITYKNIEIGGLLSPNSPFARITNLSSLKLITFVSEEDVNFFKKGNTVDVVVNEKTIKGEIIYVAARANELHKYELHVIIPNQKNQIKAGMYASLKMSSRKAENMLIIPRSALLGSIKNPRVYVVKDEVAHLRNIQVSSINDTEVEVSSGLQLGDVIVASGQINLKDGSQIRIN